ncbi:type II secretion system protein N [Sphingomonas sp.]|uniref:type II secretion system protein N n=1 Tax=Sphingomonas sp. TaxID=28214 RepID=UPI002DD686C6|nr:type II secretion system protein N [Sphingomonas sp.]
MIPGQFDLTPRRQRLILNGATVLVVVSVAAALAGLTWRLMGHADVGAITVPATRTATQVPDTAPMLALDPFGRTGIDGDGAVATTLQIALKGIVFARPAELSVAYIQVGSEAAKPFKTGEAVSGATIAAIQPRRVLLSNGGRVEFLAFPDPFAPPPGTAPAGTPAPAPAPAGNPVAAPPAGPSAEQVLQRFDAQPADGGYRIGANGPPGLRQGDVLQQLNGTPLTSPDAARAAISGAQASGTAQVQILRDGKPVTVTVPIR